MLVKGYRYILLIVCVVLFSSSTTQKEGALYNFMEKLSNSPNVSFNYKSPTAEGFISFGEGAVYLSEGDKLEIYEYRGVRYIFNRKRAKLDIEHIKPEDDRVTDIFKWIEHNLEYILTLESKESSGLTRYKLERKAQRNISSREYVAEVYDIYFNDKDELVKLSYISRESTRITFNISNMRFGAESTKQLFTFNPDNRKDMDVTDYRE